MSSFLKKVIGIVLVCALFFVPLSNALALTESDKALIQQQIQVLLIRLSELQEQLKLEQSNARLSVFTKTLSPGEYSADVKRLQTILNQKSDTLVALSGPGSKGGETMFYGPSTENAIRVFQTQENVSVTGVFDHETRIAMNGYINTLKDETLPVEEGKLAIMEGYGPADIPFLSINFSAAINSNDGSVRSETDRLAQFYDDSSYSYSQLFDKSYLPTGNGASSNPGITAGDVVDTIQKGISFAISALSIKMEGSIAGKPFICTCYGVFPMIKVTMSKKIGTKNLVFYPIPGKTAYKWYNVFTKDVKFIGEYIPVKLPCMEGVILLGACKPVLDSEGKPVIIDGFVTKIGTTLLPVKKDKVKSGTSVTNAMPISPEELAKIRSSAAN